MQLIWKIAASTKKIKIITKKSSKSQQKVYPINYIFLKLNL